MPDTGFDYLLEIQERNDVYRVMTSIPRPKPLIADDAIQNLLECGFVELLGGTKLADDGTIYRCRITEAGYRFLRQS